jgi:threonine dehydratase
MERAPAMIESLRAGRPVEIEELATLAEGLAGGIGLDNRFTFRMCQEYVDATTVVTEEDIAAAMALALEEHHLVVEGAGAVGIAALLAGRLDWAEGRVALVVSGGNVDVSVLAEIHRTWLERRADHAAGGGVPDGLVAEAGRGGYNGSPSGEVPCQQSAKPASAS